VTDNHALSLASAHARKHSLPLVILVTITPSEYKAHDRSPRRIDFFFRNLRHMASTSLPKLNIPLFVHSMPFDSKRKSQAREVIRLCNERFEAASVWGNISYEVDELERDLRLVKEGREKGVRVELRHDRLIMPPGSVHKKNGGEGIYNVSLPRCRLNICPS
jgi:deoxyribodipyrimidine photo-lyase